jgi:hypothetical protein
MTVSLKHTTQATGTDAGNGEIRKTQWNEEHTLLLAALRLLGRHAGSDGAAQEISLGTGISISGGVLNVTGQHTIFVPAAAMLSRTTGGAGTGGVETSTNKVMLKSLDFDTTTQEFAQFALQMPKSWNLGTIVAQFVWSHPTTTVNFGVVWQIQAVALSDANAGDTAFGTAVTATDTGGTTDMIYHSPETAVMTVGNTPAAEDWVVFQVARAPANGSDTLAVDARLLGVKLKYTASVATDD